MAHMKDWNTHAMAVRVAPAQKMVLLALAREADADGRCEQTAAQLARVAGTSPRTIWRALDALEKGGYLQREAAREGFSGNAYRLLLGAKK